MAARMGIATMGYDPVSELGETEFRLARENGVYPDAPTITYEDWARLREYILQGAPDSLAMPTYPPLDSMQGFTPEPLAIENRSGALVTYLGRGRSGGLLTGNGYGQLSAYRGDTTAVLATGRAPVVHYQRHPEEDLLLEIGNIYPTEASNGALYRLVEGGRDTLATGLHRPVYFLATDLDNDGKDEIVVCEYGHFTGALSLLTKTRDGRYDYSQLSGTAGAIRVVAEDLNDDGLGDLVYLHAQGDEGIDVLYRRPEGGFQTERLLSFPSVWGTSWFELVDMDNDGDLDLLTVHGDNADYSNLLKPYHGLRIWENDGTGSFTQSYFQALPGATRLVVRDFDRDGDQDIAVACNFADFAAWPSGAFVFFNNRGSAPLAFDLQTTPAAIEGRWLIMEAFDYDGDGDEDIVLGSFTLNPAPVPTELANRWGGEAVDVLLLRNLH